MPKAGKFNAERFNSHLREVTGEYAALIGSGRLKPPRFTSPIVHDLRSWSDYFMAVAALRHLFPNKAAKILELGCGPGMLSRLAAMERHEYSGADLSAVNVKAANRLGHRGVFQADATDLTGVKAGSFDVVFAHHFVAAGYKQTLDFDQKVVAQTRRVLKPGGVLLLDEAYERYVNSLLGTGWKVIAVEKPGWSHFLSAIVGFEKRFFVAYPVFPKKRK